MALWLSAIVFRFWFFWGGGKKMEEREMMDGGRSVVKMRGTNIVFFFELQTVINSL